MCIARMHHHPRSNDGRDMMYDMYPLFIVQIGPNKVHYLIGAKQKGASMAIRVVFEEPIFKPGSFHRIFALKEG